MQIPLQIYEGINAQWNKCTLDVLHHFFHWKSCFSGLLVLHPLLVGVTPKNAQTGTITVIILSAIILMIVIIVIMIIVIMIILNRGWLGDRHLQASEPSQLPPSQFQPVMINILMIDLFQVFNHNYTQSHTKIPCRCRWWVTRAQWCSPSHSSCGLFTSRGWSSFTPLYQVVTVREGLNSWWFFCWFMPTHAVAQSLKTVVTKMRVKLDNVQLCETQI